MVETIRAVIRSRRPPAGAPGRPVLVGIAGSVAVGKSTLAEEVRAALDDVSVAVVATDCFLLPSTELSMRGLVAKKGFPASYDEAAMTQFLDAVGAGRPATVPVYSHANYDRVAGAVQVVEAADVVVVEGVNALQAPFAGRLDVAVYLDADEATIRGWYLERFLALCTAAETDPTSFYAMFVPLPADGRRSMAIGVWEAVNAVNLHAHIRPSMAAATLVLRKRPDHSFSAVSP